MKQKEILQSFKPILDNGKELREIEKFITVGKPLLLAPTMDYHKTLWGLTLANSLIKKDKVVKYISLYESVEEAKKIWDEYHWGFGCPVVEEKRFIKLSSSNTVFDILKKEKLDVVIIDCLDSRFNLVDNYNDFKKMFEDFFINSIKNNISIVVISGIWPDFVKKHMKDMQRYFSTILSIKDANMVEIKPIILD